MPGETADLEFKVVCVEHWAAFKPEAAEKDGVDYLRKRGSDVIYRKTADGYECVKCGATVMTGRVAHPIWDGPFPMSGSGRCHYENVPYCQKCEHEPNFHGTPIKVEPNF